MKTTIDIADSLIQEAKEVAAAQSLTLKNLTEEGLRMVLEKRAARKPLSIKPVVMNGKGLSKEFREGGWETMRSAAYEGHGG
jgi:hypothetical protein